MNVKTASASLAFAVLASAGVAGCYSTPNPECAFLCGSDGACPSGYTCRSDNWCKRTDLADDYVCDPTLADAAVSVDAHTTDASDLDADLPPDATMPDADSTDASPPDAMTPDAMPPDAPPDAMAGCGNGTPESGESCDDHNNLACGTCSMDCTTPQPATAATGSIATVAAANLADGETFVLDDGINAPLAFEFDNGGGASGEPIDISGATTEDDVKTAIVSAVNGLSGSLEITASDGGAGLVLLTHDQSGTLGNQPITENVADTGFVVTGMSGGAARNCAAGVGCNSPDDCFSGSCTANTCD